MIDMIDLFDLYQHAKVSEVYGLQADTDRRVTRNQESLFSLERRYEYLRIVTIAMWKVVKEQAGATDEQLRRHIEAIDLLDGKRDGRITRTSGVQDCDSCGRRILKSAVVCVYCGVRNVQSEAFHGT
jgi:hypothetical protein